MAFTKYTSTHTGKEIDDAVDKVAQLTTDIGDAYVKPADGIPKTDLAQGVQDSLGLADTAIQEAALTAAIEALDKADTAVAGEYVSAVSETDGIITVTRAKLPEDNDTTYTFASGTVQGAFEVTPAGGEPQSVSIEGLKSAAFTESTAYDKAGAAAEVQTNLDAVDAIVEALQGDVDTINEKIPAQASATNQLADKAFVNSTVQSNAADFVTASNTEEGDNLFASFDALTKGPWYVGGVEVTKAQLKKNDYAMVYIENASGVKEQWRAMYDGTEWQEQYKVGSAFTAVQQAALDSGITADAVTQITTNKTDISGLTTKVNGMYTNEQIDTAISNAIDAIPAVAEATTTVKGIALLGATGGAATFDSVAALTVRVAAIEALLNSDDYDVMLVKKAVTPVE